MHRPAVTLKGDEINKTGGARSGGQRRTKHGGGFRWGDKGKQESRESAPRYNNSKNVREIRPASKK